MKISDAMHTKLEKIKARYAEVGELLSKNEVICDQEKFRSLSKEHSDLEPIVEILTDISNTRAILTTLKR